MADTRLEVDARWEELGRIYRDATARLRALVQAALERGAEGTADYRRRQLGAVMAELQRLEEEGIPVAIEAVRAAYSAGAVGADRAIGGPAIGFSGIHREALEVLADALIGRLTAAMAVVGRRVEDAFRKVALREVAAGIATGAARRDVSAALERRLIEDGVTDALTGFVDAGGRRWQLDTYAEMVARTTTREAVSRGTANRLEEAGRITVTISAHADSCSICIPYQGNTYALPGHQAHGLRTLDRLPPFHPNCRHVLTPAASSFEDFEAELGIAADQPLPEEGALQAGQAPELEPAAGVADRRTGYVPVQPSQDAATPTRKAAQDLIDPGPEAGAQEARRAWQDATAEQEAAYREELARLAAEPEEAVDTLLGDDLRAFLADLARSGVKWAKDEALYQAIIDGDVTLEEIRDLAETEMAEREGRKAKRLEQEGKRGYVTKPIPCFSCGRFKRRPADVCDTCGDDPVQWGTSAQEFNQAYGYQAEAGERYLGAYSNRGDSGGGMG